MLEHRRAGEGAVGGLVNEAQFVVICPVRPASSQPLPGLILGKDRSQGSLFKGRAASQACPKFVSLMKESSQKPSERKVLIQALLKTYMTLK